MRKIKRKGELLPDNVASVVIVVIGLGFLILAVGTGVYNFFSNQEEQNAQKTLDSLMGKINALEDGESNEFLIQGVEDWYLVGYDLSDELRPDKCFFNSCVCICESPNPSGCQKDGICREVGFENVNVFTENFRDLTDKVNPNLQAPGGGTSVIKTVEDISPLCIKVNSKLTPIIVLKNKENLSVHSNRGEYVFEDYKFCNLN